MAKIGALARYFRKPTFFVIVVFLVRSCKPRQTTIFSKNDFKNQRAGALFLETNMFAIVKNCCPELQTEAIDHFGKFSQRTKFCKVSC
jgi:hypothetical protein